MSTSTRAGRTSCLMPLWSQASFDSAFAACSRLRRPLCRPLVCTKAIGAVDEVSGGVEKNARGLAQPSGGSLPRAVVLAGARWRLALVACRPLCLELVGVAPVR